MAETTRTVLERMLDLRDEIEARLLGNDDYRTLKALNQAIAQVSGSDEDDEIERVRPVQNGRSKPAPADVEIGGLSQADATFALLTSVVYEPMKIDGLMKALNAHGIKVGGARPHVNLSSVLSKDGRFRSVKYKDRACWWVKGKPFPGELDNQ